MPRNDQVTRQWHLIRHLEATARGATLQELAASVPADYQKHHRTIRRDLEALEAAGFPLLTERLEGRVVWKLLEGFRRVPALAFSPTELMALTFSRGLLRPLEGRSSRRPSTPPSRKPPRPCRLPPTATSGSSTAFSPSASAPTPATGPTGRQSTS